MNSTRRTYAIRALLAALVGALRRSPRGTRGVTPLIDVGVPIRWYGRGAKVRQGTAWVCFACPNPQACVDAAQCVRHVTAPGHSDAADCPGCTP